VARRYADLDLALEWHRALEVDLSGRIAEALFDSVLPYKVDTVDLLQVDPAFTKRTSADRIALPVDHAAA
jgi:hypothetical protein